MKKQDEDDTAVFDELEEEGVDIPSIEEPIPEKESPSEPFRPLDFAPDIPVQLVAVMAKKTVSVKDLMELEMGQVIDLNRPPSETVDLVANGRLVARGELVYIDWKLGVRVVKPVHSWEVYGRSFFRDCDTVGNSIRCCRLHIAFCQNAFGAWCRCAFSRSHSQVCCSSFQSRKKNSRRENVTGCWTSFAGIANASLHCPYRETLSFTGCY